MYLRGVLLVQENLLEKLSNYQELQGSVLGIFQDSEEQELPYLVFGEATSNEYGTKLLGEDVVQTLEVYGRSRSEVGETIAKIHRALQEEIIIPNYDCHMWKIQSLDIVNLEDGNVLGKIQLKLKITEVL
ncbi:DUF3168 domain-containing protein [Alkaliphilus transvaalensis]|uniref:DUF3168 domain-containing protein n=1 Tax=Alkaliphilus transvaalensis TaxID=114628 RepID=UPI00047D414D|nr:DUF3168 domain-containing protein [Alkaliphilus transvaalensis]